MLIIRYLVLMAVTTGLRWLQRTWPDDAPMLELDVDAPIDLWPTNDVDEPLLDWLVRNDVQVPDDARGLS